VQRYNSPAHHLLATNNLAPQLHYSSLNNAEAKTMGTLGVVIMDFVEGTNAYELYTNMQLPDAVYNRVKEAIDILHTKSIVFGDLRLPNIIITDQQKPILIDFDWCGMDTTNRYPPSLNDVHSIAWHPEVARNGIMSMDHDIYMLNAMKPGHPMDLSH
jgi:serine/threonine protein kinase